MLLYRRDDISGLRYDGEWSPGCPEMVEFLLRAGFSSFSERPENRSGADALVQVRLNVEDLSRAT